MTAAKQLLHDAEMQEAAARHARKIGMNYLASRHEDLARRLRVEAKLAAVEATGGTEAS